MVASELAERGDELIVRLDLPGVVADDVTVEISAAGLIVKGERKPASPSDQVLMSEQPYGKFYRVIPIPGKVEEDRVSARFQNGILEISLPAQRIQNQSRQIYVAMHPGIHTTDPPPPLKPPPDKTPK
jgi:HSP20 family protein